MTVEQCYATMNGNYEEAKRRLMNDALIQKFLIKFLSDTSFDNLSAALAEKDYLQAFKAAHSLKGVSQNMALDALSAPVSELTEELRDGNYSDKVPELFESVQKNYEIVKTTILELQNSAL